MGGIGLSCEQPQPNTSRTYIRTHIRTYTYAITHTYMQHTEDNREQDNTTQDTNNIAQPQRKEHSTYDLHIYSFDFYCLRQYIKKLYNTAIY